MIFFLVRLEKKALAQTAAIGGIGLRLLARADYSPRPNNKQIERQNIMKHKNIEEITADTPLWWGVVVAVEYELHRLVKVETQMLAGDYDHEAKLVAARRAVLAELLGEIGVESGA